MEFLDERIILIRLLDERKSLTFKDITEYAIDLYKKNKDIAVDLSRDNVLSIINRNPSTFKIDSNNVITLNRDNELPGEVNEIIAKYFWEFL